jgi:hypothetical protein
MRVTSHMGYSHMGYASYKESHKGIVQRNAYKHTSHKQSN